MVAAPPAGEELKPLRHVLSYISSLEEVTTPLIDNWDGVPVLFKEQDRYFVGWQLPGLLSKELGCEYHAQWQANRNELPPQQQGEGRIIIEKGEIQAHSLKAPEKGKTRKPPSKFGAKVTKRVWNPPGKFNGRNTQGMPAKMMKMKKMKNR
jgi:hypothetical protein